MTMALNPGSPDEFFAYDLSLTSAFLALKLCSQSEFVLKIALTGGFFVEPGSPAVFRLHAIRINMISNGKFVEFFV